MARKASGTDSTARTSSSTVTTTRSRTGCMTCRRRKLKCDEVRPICVNCQKGHRECVLADALTFRNQQNPSLNGGSDESAGGLGNFYGYKDRFRSDAVWLPIQEPVRFVYVTNPYAQDSEAEIMGESGTGYQQMATHTLEALSTAATRDSTSQYTQAYPPTPSIADSNVMFAAYPPYAARANASSALNSAVIDPNLEAVSNEQRNHVDQTTNSPEMSLPFQVKMEATQLADAQSDDHVATILRKFSEGPAQWMDLFDPNNFFAFQSSTRSANCPVIRSVCLALGAKCIAVKINSSLAMSSSITGMSPLSNLNAAMYESSATFFRDRALEHIEVSIATPSLSLSLDSFTALALMCFLEIMDSSWSGSDLLNAPTAEALAAQALVEGSGDDFRSVFFETVRYDCLSAFINERHAVFDPENINLWRAVGIQIDSESGFFDNSLTTSGPRATARYLCNVLFWIIIKIINFIADGDRVIFDPSESQSPIGVSQQTLLEKWHQLNTELDMWHQTLPSTFTPAARITPSGITPRLRAFTEVWYHIPMCASAMQFYHMARVLLLINKPHESTARRSTIATRLKSYASIALETGIHAREICGISASKPKDAVRIHSVQPLFVAGHCLEKELERKSVLDMLSDIQLETGWSTGYRVRQLRNEWGWS